MTPVRSEDLTHPVSFDPGIASSFPTLFGNPVLWKDQLMVPNGKLLLIFFLNHSIEKGLPKNQNKAVCESGESLPTEAHD